MSASSDRFPYREKPDCSILHLNKFLGDSHVSWTHSVQFDAHQVSLKEGMLSVVCFAASLPKFNAFCLLGIIMQNLIPMICMPFCSNSLKHLKSLHLSKLYIICIITWAAFTCWCYLWYWQLYLKCISVSR